jgi:hypothetical protein
VDNALSERRTQKPATTHATYAGAPVMDEVIHTQVTYGHTAEAIGQAVVNARCSNGRASMALRAWVYDTYC